MSVTECDAREGWTALEAAVFLTMKSVLCNIASFCIVCVNHCPGNTAGFLWSVR